MVRRSVRFWLLCLLWACGSVGAQQASNGLFSINSAAVSIQLDASGTAYGLDREGQVWRKVGKANSNWQRLPGSFAALRVGMDDSVWGITSDAQLFKLVSQTWWQKFAADIADVAAGPDGLLAVLAIDGKVLQLDANSGEKIVQLPPVDLSITRLRADEHGLLWAWSNTASQPYLRRFDGRQWLPVTPPSGVGLRELSVGPQGTIMVVTQLGAVHRWDPATKQWFLLDQITSAVDIALGPDDKPWFLTSSGRILATDLFIQNDATRAETKPALFTRLLKWKRVRGTATDLSISAQGDVLTVDAESNVWQWKGKDNWTLMPGRMRKVAAAAQGAWGIDLEGRVLKFIGGYWAAQGLSQATHIAAADNGDAFALADNGKLFVFNAIKRQWFAAGGPVASYLAVGKSLPWLIDLRGRVWTWRDGAWAELPITNAQTIGVGSEGSVYITTPEQTILWLDQREKVWKAASGKASKIVVGAGGAPWIVGERNETYGSTLFFAENDKVIQTRDAQSQAAARPVFTVPPPAASVLPPSTKPVSLTALTGAYQDVGVGADGSVLAVGVDGGLYCLQKAEQRFASLGGATGRRIAVDQGGTPWLINQAQDIQHFSQGRWQIIADFKAQDIAVGSDNTVYAIEKNQQAVYKITDGVPNPVLGSDGALIRAKKLAILGAQLWLITLTDRVSVCTTRKCNAYSQTAQAIAASADGSVMVVDNSGTLLRYDPKTDSFVSYPTTVNLSKAVSLALQGIPWLVSQAGVVSGPVISAKNTNMTDKDCTLRFKGQAPNTAPVTAQLIARADSASITPGSTLNILANDTINTSVPNPSAVLIKLQSASPYLSVVPGGVILNPQTPIGTTVTAVYTICVQPAGAPCASAPISIVTIASPQNNGPALLAQADSFSVYQGITRTLNVLANDSFNGLQVNLNSVNLRLNPGSSPLLSVTAVGIEINTGASSIGQLVQGAYTMCLRASNATCAQATIQVQVSSPVQANPVTYTTAGRFCLACNATFLGQPLSAGGNGPPLPFYGFTSGGDYFNQTSGFIGINAAVGYIDYNGEVQINASAPAPAVYSKDYTVCVTRDFFATCATATATSTITINLPAPVLVANNWNLNVQANQTYNVTGFGSYNGQNFQEINSFWNLTNTPTGNPFVFYPGQDAFGNPNFGLLYVTPTAQIGSTRAGTFNLCNRLVPTQCVTSNWSMTVVP
jgi:hypothetical protein